jgi:endonuclease YncB( thermonuclease family)
VKHLLAILIAVCLLGANRYELSEIRVIDGDTIQADVALGYGVALRKESIRMADLDAWEATNNRRTVIITAAEIVKGKEASRVLTKLLADSKSVTLEPIHQDRDGYGRLLGRIYADGNSVASFMKSGGHARRVDE